MDALSDHLQELINDEDKIVTVATAASILHIKVGFAKELLEKYIRDHKGKISATYILSGTLKDCGESVVRLVKDDDLGEERTKFTDVQETVYSLQKSPNIDFNVISMANKEQLMEPLLGYVVSQNSQKRVWKMKKLPPVAPTTTTTKKTSFFTKQPPKNVSPKKDNTKNSPVNKQSPQKKTNFISNMFGNMPPKKDKENIGSNKNNAESQKEQNKNKVQIEEDDFGMDVDTDIEEQVEVKPKTEAPAKKAKKEDTKEEKKKATTKRTRKDKGADPPSKRRRRIVERNDSDSDDIFEKDDNQDEDIVNMTDEESEPPKKRILPPKNKVKRAVEKTYEDEEGFIVTKTEYILESASETEQETEPKKTPKAEPKPKMEKKTSSTSESDVSPKKGAKGKKGKVETKNQPSIMSFFKKK